MSEVTRAQVEVSRERCPYCHEDVAPDQPKVACDACMAWHHSECWAEYGACAACAASQVAGRPCTWRGWGGNQPACPRSGELVEGSQQSLCPEHRAEFDRGRRMAAPVVLIVLGTSLLLGAAAFLRTTLLMRPIHGLFVTATAVMASLGLYMLWLAWARWPEKAAPEASSPGKDEPPKSD